MNINTDILLKVIKLGRPQFIVGGFLFFCIGAFLAVLFNAEFLLSKFVFGYAILFTAHLAVHYSNDYFDFDIDLHSTPTAISGGSGILIGNPELKRFSKWFAVTLIGLSLILAIIFTSIFSYSILFFLFVLFGNLLAWFYSAPPIRLVYRRLGEISQ
jgi:1,4-dihydroxy-2-naphthoate polyprenyltransferase